MWICHNQRIESKEDYTELTADFDGNKTKNSDFMLFFPCLDSPSHLVKMQPLSLVVATSTCLAGNMAAVIPVQDGVLRRAEM